MKVLRGGDPGQRVLIVPQFLAIGVRIEALGQIEGGEDGGRLEGNLLRRPGLCGLRFGGSGLGRLGSGLAQRVEQQLAGRHVPVSVIVARHHIPGRLPGGGDFRHFEACFIEPSALFFRVDMVPFDHDGTFARSIRPQDFLQPFARLLVGQEKP